MQSLGQVSLLRERTLDLPKYDYYLTVNGE